MRHIADHLWVASSLS